MLLQALVIVSAIFSISACNESGGSGVATIAARGGIESDVGALRVAFRETETREVSPTRTERRFELEVTNLGESVAAVDLVPRSVSVDFDVEPTVFAFDDVESGRTLRADKELLVSSDIDVDFDESAIRFTYSTTATRAEVSIASITPTAPFSGSIIAVRGTGFRASSLVDLINLDTMETYPAVVGEQSDTALQVVVPFAFDSGTNSIVALGAGSYRLQVDGVAALLELADPPPADPVPGTSIQRALSDTNEQLDLLSASLSSPGGGSTELQGLTTASETALDFAIELLGAVDEIVETLPVDVLNALDAGSRQEPSSAVAALSGVAPQHEAAVANTSSTTFDGAEFLESRAVEFATAKRVETSLKRLGTLCVAVGVAALALPATTTAAAGLTATCATINLAARATQFYIEQGVINRFGKVEDLEIGAVVFNANGAVVPGSARDSNPLVLRDLLRDDQVELQIRIRTVGGSDQAFQLVRVAEITVALIKAGAALGRVDGLFPNWFEVASTANELLSTLTGVDIPVTTDGPAVLREGVRVRNLAFETTIFTDEVIPPPDGPRLATITGPCVELEENEVVDVPFTVDESRQLDRLSFENLPDRSLLFACDADISQSLQLIDSESHPVAITFDLPCGLSRGIGELSESTITFEGDFPQSEPAGSQFAEFGVEFIGGAINNCDLSGGPRTCCGVFCTPDGSSTMLYLLPQPTEVRFTAAAGEVRSVSLQVLGRTCAGCGCSGFGPSVSALDSCGQIIATQRGGQGWNTLTFNARDSPISSLRLSGNGCHFADNLSLQALR